MELLVWDVDGGVGVGGLSVNYGVGLSIGRHDARDHMTAPRDRLEVW